MTNFFDNKQHFIKNIFFSLFLNTRTEGEMQSGTCKKKLQFYTLVIHNFLLYCKYNFILCNLQVQNCNFFKQEAAN